MLSRLTVEKYIEFSALEQKIKSSLQYSLLSTASALYLNTTTNLPNYKRENADLFEFAPN